MDKTSPVFCPVCKESERMYQLSEKGNYWCLICRNVFDSAKSTVLGEANNITDARSLDQKN